MNIQQFNEVNTILVAKCKSFVILLVEWEALGDSVNLELPNGVYQLCIYVLAYRNILTSTKYNLINQLWKTSQLPEPARDLINPNDGNGNYIIPIALVSGVKC